MGIRVGCARGCGHMIEITSEAMKEMVELGQGINISHDVCPGEVVDEKRKYHIVITLFEVHDGPTDVPDDPSEQDYYDIGVPVEEKIASFGAYAEGVNFQATYAELGKKLGEQWEKVGEQASFIDMDMSLREDDDEDEAHPKPRKPARNVLRRQDDDNNPEPGNGLIMI